jgi:hypothetical protein
MGEFRSLVFFGAVTEVSPHIAEQFSVDCVGYR